jgi:ribonucleoside-diphosphate reductase alpha chain
MNVLSLTRQIFILEDLVELGLWNDSLKQDIMRANGSVQNIDSIPQDIKELYKTVWELSMKDIIDMSRHRGYFIDQSQSLNLFMEGATMAKLTSMHFYAWKSGLKTGMYYLRTKSAVDAIKFTLDTKKNEEPAAEVDEVVEVAQVEASIVEKQKEKAAQTAAKFAQKTTELSTEKVEVQPMSPDEMKAIIAQAKAAEGDDCLMCGS